MRLTPKLLVKLVGVILFFLFIVPMLYHLLEETERNRAEASQTRRRREYSSHGETAKVIENQAVLRKPNTGDKDDEVADDKLRFVPKDDVRKVVAHVHDVDSEDHFRVVTQLVKTNAPTAVFRKGVLGNYEQEQGVRSGPGEYGEPVFTSLAEKGASDRSMHEYGFNMVASDKISLDRNVPDTRLQECKYWYYPEVEKLPTASVILVFHNEGWSTLLRTVHSVINKSHPKLLKEVVLVDDFSDKEHLKSKLDEYIKRFDGKVKLYRNEKREGLIRTRTAGARYATGDVIIFLDAHCECNINWLAPLLARIAYDRTIMAVPIVDSISKDNMAYHASYGRGHFRGIFEWGFLYKESSVPEKELKKRIYNSEPFWSPTHAGGLFAMDRKYFFELGAYDPGLLIWGGENFELSFKIWQCGGKVEWVPCSRVGHIYRSHMPYSFGNISPKIPIISQNYMRVVEVWLDNEYKEYFYTREPVIRGYPIGNLTSQLELKKRLNCKSFKWFMENIAYEVTERFPPPPPNKVWGEIKQAGSVMCVDTMGAQPGQGKLGLSPCHHFGGNQLFRLNTMGQLATGERCIKPRKGEQIAMMYFCPVSPNGPWDYNQNTKQITVKDWNMCLEGYGSRITLNACDASKTNQQWDINEVYPWKRM
ncbi:N-acetylgalactosaminyltransferase 7-like isoform X2 [Lineus longissimus]|uniref:N-acetylgalactosaminyltransferase 7-like isoform X2 n=1 Tax=Lineus longissimus TaxID=88925 RepID=UPI00315D3EE2